MTETFEKIDACLCTYEPIRYRQEIVGSSFSNHDSWKCKRKVEVLPTIQLFINTGMTYTIYEVQHFKLIYL